jgi:hypothetical protein
MGNADFYTGSLQSTVIGIMSANRPQWNGVSGVTVWWNQIWLPRNFSVQNVVHELGHVLDNNYALENKFWPATYAGGGAADSMLLAMGGDPFKCIPRWSCAGLYANIAGNDHWPSGYYGATSIADDFAETFMNDVFGNYVPPERLMWMDLFVTLT